MANNNIAENLKKYFYSGIGFASHTSDLIRGYMDEYVKAGRMNEADGKGIVDDMIKKIEEQKAALEDKYNEAAHSFVSMTTDEMATLQRKIESLEMQLKAKGSHKNVNRSSGSSSKGKSQSHIKKAVKSIAKKAAPIKKAVAKKAAIVKKAVAKKAASVKKAVAKKAGPVKKAVAKKVAPKKAAKKAASKR